MMDHAITNFSIGFALGDSKAFLAIPLPVATTRSPTLKLAPQITKRVALPAVQPDETYRLFEFGHL